MKFDGPCPFLFCLKTEPHEHKDCPDCGAVWHGNMTCPTCREYFEKFGRAERMKPFVH